MAGSAGSLCLPDHLLVSIWSTVTLGLNIFTTAGELKGLSDVGSDHLSTCAPPFLIWHHRPVHPIPCLAGDWEVTEGHNSSQEEVIIPLGLQCCGETMLIVLQWGSRQPQPQKIFLTAWCSNGYLTEPSSTACSRLSSQLLFFHGPVVVV